MKVLGLIALVLSSNAFSLEQRYPQSLLAQAQDTICHQEDSARAMKLAQDMHTRVQASLEAEAKAAQLSIEDYLNKKQTHDAFLVALNDVSRKEKLEAMEQPEFMLLSLEMGLRFQILATVRFPSLSMIDQAGEVLQNQWLPIVEEISNNPKGCSSSPQVNSSERGNSSDKSQPSQSPSAPAPGAVSR